MTPSHPQPLLRRDFLRASAGAIALLGSAALAGANGRELFPAVDAHTHFYDATRPQGVPWPGKQDALLYRKVLPAEFRELTRPQKIVGTIAVECSPWLEDNQWLLDMVAGDQFVWGIVGNLDPASDEFPRHFERFARNRLFLGFRIGHDKLRPGLENKTFIDNLRLLIRHDREIDINGGPDMPADVARLAQVLPDLRIVINHAGNLPIDGKPVPDAWRQGMRAAAAGKNVFCKVSALVDGTHKHNRDAPVDPGFYRPVLDAVWEIFGEDRLVYASNWPVSENYASYATVHRIVHSYFSERGNRAAEKFFLGNCLSAYKPHRRGG